jgi:hypothetical protein
MSVKKNGIMERLDQFHLREVPRLTCLGGDLNPGLWSGRHACTLAKSNSKSNSILIAIRNIYI